MPVSCARQCAIDVERTLSPPTLASTIRAALAGSWATWALARIAEWVLLRELARHGSVVC
ncbi:MAG TPA: hypothetical protein VKU92_11215 [Acidimicrobiales bacterium]|nr:hypothetical protein [Acidimicrobiales bacterium]